MLRPDRSRATPPIGPAWGERGTLATGGGEIVYWAAGDGPPVLLLHGWEGSHRDMDAFVEPILTRGRSVVAPDLIAHGESGGTTASLFDLGDCALAVAGAFADIEGAIAHSVGCVALARALERGAAVPRAVLIAPPLDYGEFVRYVAAQLDVEHAALVGAFAARGVDVTQMNFHETARHLEAPALLVHSRDDRVTAFAGSESIAKSWRGSRLLPMDGLGHRRILRDPATIEATVDFVLR